MKYGETRQLHIEEMDHKGRGCGKINDRRACAYFAFPGETVEARLVGRAQGSLKMEADEILEGSPHRIEPACPHAGECGGCKWQQLDYEYQLNLKHELVSEALAPVGLAHELPPVTPCPEPYYYRNRMDYAFGWQGELGLKAPGRWNKYVNLTDCRLLSPETPAILDAIRAWRDQHELQPWDSKFHRGFLRYLTIREGKNTNERLIMLLTTSEELPAAAREDLIARLKPHATTLLHGISDRLTDLSIADKTETLFGPDHLTEEIAGVRFRIPVNSFFQTNSLMAAALVETVKTMLGPQPINHLLDLYCGAGFFGLCLAGLAQKVTGIELDEAAIRLAETNAAANEIKHATFQAAAAESLIWKDETPDTVIIDPPRVGLHPKVTETLLANRPARLAYISCNYRSLARDWQTLKTAYRCTALQALDLFPHSPHVETVALLERIDS
jgi:23S rRNA (uracil1939-C5)-methyltransferase